MDIEAAELIELSKDLYNACIRQSNSLESQYGDFYRFKIKKDIEAVIIGMCRAGYLLGLKSKTKKTKRSK